MGRFFVAGLINIETTLAVDGFPLNYFPVRYPFFGIQTTISGVGFNIANALTSLGNAVDLASLVGTDANGELAQRTLGEAGISGGLVRDILGSTPQSVILYESNGRRQIHVDLKDIQEQEYPPRIAEEAIRACDLAVICNINFARPLLSIARDAGKLVATDVHALADLSDDYNQDFMHQADILFLSDENLPDTPEKIAREIMEKFGARIVVIGMGEKGATLAVRADNFVGQFETQYTRPIVNTIGAGDALFSAFIDRFQRTADPYQALRAAMVFASYKIGENGAASGFLTGHQLDEWLNRVEKS